MPRMMNTVLAASFVLTGCSAAEKAESTVNASPTPVVRPIERHNAAVQRDADENGNYVGVYMYPSPWAKPEDHVEAYPHGHVGTALCEQQGRRAQDENVPTGAPFVYTNTWIRFEDGRFENGLWSPRPYFDLGGVMLRQCAEFNLASPPPVGQ